MPGQQRTEDDLGPGIASWNAGEFAEAADHWEEVWVGEVGASRECLRGVIHAAMGLHYAVAGDPDAARSKLATAARLLAPFPGSFLGLDIQSLRSAVGMIRARVERENGDGAPSGFLGDVALPRL